MRRLKHNTQNFTTFVVKKKTDRKATKKPKLEELGDIEEKIEKTGSNMKHPYFFLFFSVFIILYALINSFIYIHGYRMLGAFNIHPWIYNSIFGFLACAYILGEAIQDRKSTVFTDVLITIGGLWFVGIVHFFFISLLYDSLKFTNIFTHWISRENMSTIAYHTTWITVIGTIATIVFGYINARTPKVKYFHFHLDKKRGESSLVPLSRGMSAGQGVVGSDSNPPLIPPLTGGHETIRLVVASDIHLGATNGVGHILRIVKKMNSLKPDIILLPGDIVDGEIDPVIRRDIGSHLRKFEATHGVWGVTGNHEYIGGISEAVKYLTEHGINLLQDEWVEVGGIVLIGRKDHSSKRFGPKRKSLEEIMSNPGKICEHPQTAQKRSNSSENRAPERAVLGVQGVRSGNLSLKDEFFSSSMDRKKALILMDHQPRHLEVAEQNGIDIQFSGHTHNGQLWPLQYIVRHVFEIAAGYKKKGNTHIIVSSGIGTWGPPVRTNARPEILCVDIELKD